MSQLALDSDTQRSHPPTWRRVPADETHTSPSLSPPCIDHSMMPHIFEAILAHVAATHSDALPTLRGVSRELRDWVHERMAKHIVVCADDSTDVFPANTSMPKGDQFRSSVIEASSALPTTCDTTTDDDPLPVIMTATVTRLGTCAAPFPAFGGWNAMRRQGDAELDDTHDALLKRTTAVDFIGTLSRFQTITAMLNVPVPVARFVSDDWPNVLAEEAIQADTAVVFTRPMTRRFGNVHPAMGVKRLVIHIGVPRVGLFPRGDNADDGDEFYEGPWVCAPNGPLSAREIVYIFDPAWADVEVHLRRCSMLDPILIHVSRVLAYTRVKFVGLDAFPIRAFSLAHDDLGLYSLVLDRLDVQLDILADRIPSDMPTGWSDTEMDDDTCKLMRLAQLVPSDDEKPSINDIRDRVAEKRRSNRYKTMKTAVGEEVRRQITRSARGTPSYEFPYNPYQPRSAWPIRKVEKLIDENMGFYTWEEYRALVDEDEWLLHTVGYNAS